MMAPTRNQKPSSFLGTSAAFICSLAVHGVILLIATAGFLWDSEPPPITETPIMVEFATEEAKAPPKQEKKKPEPKEETPPPLDDKPQPAPKALEPPKPTSAPKAEKTEEKPVERIKPTTPEKPKEDPKPKPEKPKDKPKPPEKPKEQPKPKTPEKPAEKDTQAEFTSVLKNLADTQPKDTGKDGPKLTESPVVDRMTTGELGALRQQLQGCWLLLPGAANADALAVNLTITVNRDRTVRDVTITDMTRYQNDAFFRAAADNAMRAIRHPDCTPLDLPPLKYDEWKTITLNFDPRTMF